MGGALAIWFLISMGRSIVNGMRSNNQSLRAIALGSTGGIFALLVHSFFDFNLQIPSNALLFLSLCSIVCSVASVPQLVPALATKVASVEARELVRSAY